MPSRLSNDFGGWVLQTDCCFSRHISLKTFKYWLFKIPEANIGCSQKIDIHTIKKVLPSVNEDDIKSTLEACDGYINAAVTALLGDDEGTFWC